MQISEYNVPGLCAGEIGIAEMTWHRRFVVCIACDESLEKVIIEFENEFLAGRFADAVEAGTAEILIEEDFSLDALGEEAKLNMSWQNCRRMRSGWRNCSRPCGKRTESIPKERDPVRCRELSEYSSCSMVLFTESGSEASRIDLLAGLRNSIY
jgi:hypothetical protein